MPVYGNEFYLRVVNSISHEWAHRVDHSKIKFISTRGHVISSIYSSELFTKFVFLLNLFSEGYLKGHYHNVAHAWTWSVFFHQKTIELSLCYIMPTSLPWDKCYLYPIHRSCSWKKVVYMLLNEIITKSNLDKMSASKRLALYAISRYLYINLSMAVWFCWSRFNRKVVLLQVNTLN